MSEDYTVAEFPRKATRTALDRLLGPRRRPEGGVRLKQAPGPEEGTWVVTPEVDLYYWLLDRADLAEDLTVEAHRWWGGTTPTAADACKWVSSLGGSLDGTPVWWGTLQIIPFVLGGEPAAVVIETDRDEYLVVDLPIIEIIEDIGKVDAHVLPALGQTGRKGRGSFGEVYSPPTYEVGEPLKLGPSGRWLLARDTSWQVIFQVPYPQLF